MGSEIASEHTRHVTTEELSALIDGRSDQPESAIRAHLAECAVCARDLEGLQIVRGLLAALPIVAPPRSFVVQPPASGSNVVSFRRARVWTRVAAALAAACFVVLLSADILTSGVASPEAMQAASTQVREAAPQMMRAAPDAKVADTTANRLAESAQPPADGHLATTSMSISSSVPNLFRIAWIAAGGIMAALVILAIWVSRTPDRRLN
jgi:hypothetical protein